MAMPVYQTISTTGAATPIILDNAVGPFNVSFAVELQAGTATFGVQYTLDNLNAAIDLGPQANTTVTWFTDANVGTATTSSSVGNYMFPVTAVRVNVASSGSLLMQFAVLQGYPS